MVSKKIADFANTISFTVKEDSAFGFIDNFLVSLYESGNKKCFFVYYYFDKSIPDSDGNPVSIMTLSESLSTVFSKYEITDYSHKDHGIEIICSLSYKSYYSLIKDTVKVLSSFDAVKNNVCAECLKELSKNDRRFRLSQDDINYLFCYDCVKETEYVISEKSENAESTKNEEETEVETEAENEVETTPDKKGSTLKGVFGGILFALGVAICFVLLYAYVLPIPEHESSFKIGYYVSWVSAFIAVASFCGYKIFSKEHISNKQIIVSAVISIVFSFIAQYFSSIVLFARERVFTIDGLTNERFSKMIPSLLKLPFTDKNVSPDFKIYVLMNFIFVIIALLVISFFMYPKSKSQTIVEEL